MAPRTPVVAPHEYFERNGFELRPAATAVTLAALSLVVALVGFGVLVVRRFETAGGGGDVSGAVWSALAGYLVGVVLAIAIGWVVVAGVLHLLARAVVGHDGDFGETLVVAGWGTLPTVLTSFVAFGVLAVALGDASTTTPRMFADQFQANVRRSSVLTHAVGFVVAGWETYLYGHGLSVAFDARSSGPFLVGGLVAYGGWLLTLF
ncbi:YIP1 family protein [Halobacterium rubrum]|uniref:YIP1 family protein n=1 Tax=Halobacterium TaxID=2239 RepID=UPI001F013117|nr:MULTISPECIES: YIP1 family protein [Halobacterium]MDH5020144.1 YIP1 family protein [Halobacterium rubrum]